MTDLVKISDIREMNPLVFSALEEMNLVFILMMLFCGETQIWLGDLRVALVFGVSCSWFELICHSYGPYVFIFFFGSQIFTAYAIVRTEPSAISATPEEKKVFILMMSSTVMVDIVFARFMFCTFYWR